MKRKNQKLLSCAAIILAALSLSVFCAACDMVYVNDPVSSDPNDSDSNYSGILTEEERDEYEKNGHFLKLICMPDNTQVSNFFSVQVSNSVSPIGKLDLKKSISFYKDNESSTKTFYLPLAYSDDSEFLETGSFFTSFTIHVDAVTNYIVETSEKLLINYIDGRGVFDIRNIPSLNHNINISCLTLINLPTHIIPNNVSNVFISNQTGKIATCNNINGIIMEDHELTSTIKIPLVYTSSNQRFEETGAFFVSFDLNVDAFIRITVLESDKLSVNFVKGNALLDVSLIGGDPSVSSLTISNLPSNTQKNHFSNVFVYSTAGKVAECSEYKEIMVFRESSGSVSAIIPLSYCNNDDNRKDYFSDSGVFAVSFTISIDFLTQIIVNLNNNLTLNFIYGSAFLDASLIPLEPPLPYLTIKNLPPNTYKHNLSNVFLYNSVNTVAKCSDYNEILIAKDSDSITANIPLVYNSKDEYFRDSGTFIVSFSLYLDIHYQIIKNREDGYTVYCINGSGTVDLSNDSGFFSGGLTNPDDLNAPIVKRGTIFEMNGSYYSLNADTAVVSTSFPATCLVYVYASLAAGKIEFECSTTPPVYDSFKKAYYNGLKRALFKFIYIRDSVNRYFAKRLFTESFSNLSYCTAVFPGFPSQGLTLHYSLSGSGNPIPQTETLQEGAYVFLLTGAGGGNSSKSGGSGGIVSDLIIITKNTSFTFYTGQGGNSAPSLPFIDPKGLTGAGGGSGSFAFSPDGYLLCAGGGGGSGGDAYAEIDDYRPNPQNPGRTNQGVVCGFGGQGGSGGSVGPGGSGINGGMIIIENGTVFPTPGLISGGGSGPSNTLLISGAGLGYSGLGGSNITQNSSAAYFNFLPPNDWMNTNDANGRGGNGAFPNKIQIDLMTYMESMGSLSAFNISPAVSAGESGGNNRDSTRGGGSSPGVSGSIAVYKVF
jgi:hypothetical protein